VEESLKVRMKKFIPGNIDLVDYDRELLQKQLELQIMEITLKRDAEREAEADHPQGMPYYVRHVRRENNEEAMFRRLQEELSQIAKEYDRTEETINEMFIEVCCSKTKLIEVLKG
jgi:hypothetical protein